MFSLALPTTTTWLDLPHGVRVLVRPLDSTVHAAALAKVTREIRAMEAQRAELLETGLPVDHLPDLADDDLRRGIVAILLARGLARYGIAGWEGIEQPYSPDMAEQLMRHADMANAFLAAYQAPIAALATEGNGSAPAPNGTSTGAQPTAADAAPAAPTAPLH